MFAEWGLKIPRPRVHNRQKMHRKGANNQKRATMESSVGGSSTGCLSNHVYQWGAQLAFHLINLFLGIKMKCNWIQVHLLSVVAVPHVAVCSPALAVNQCCFFTESLYMWIENDVRMVGSSFTFKRVRNSVLGSKWPSQQGACVCVHDSTGQSVCYGRRQMAAWGKQNKIKIRVKLWLHCTQSTYTNMPWSNRML